MAIQRMMRNVEVAPCPFCGGEDVRMSHGAGGAYMTCEDCGGCGPTLDDEDAVLDTWNRRAGDAAYRAGAEAMRERAAGVADAERDAARQAHDTPAWCAASRIGTDIRTLPLEDAAEKGGGE